MMLDMKIPSPGESITEVEIAQWLVETGDYVDKDQIIAEIDSDKATLELPAEDGGTIELIAQEGDVVEVGQVVCRIDTSAERPEGKEEAPTEVAKEEPQTAQASANETTAAATPVDENVKATPVAAKMMQSNGVQGSKVKGTGAGGKITKKDVEYHLKNWLEAPSSGWSGSREEERKRMSTLRRKLSKRLVAVKNETAMLTTFNEVDMSAIMEVRSKYKDKFKEHHGIGLGFMSFFTKACTEALQHFPTVNSMIDGDEMISYSYVDVGIAVSSPKGLMVPVLRNAETMNLAEIESEIKRLAVKARDGKLSLDEMTGGTFTITNGGVFGSMLSTPILNPPQSAILGMHNIVERPVAVNGKVEIRPIMYVALSYDHRIVDGKESVSFLYMVKEMLENPERLMFGGKPPVEVLLGL
jgi:2-oxoglutarate dehydrogenase E2 component (dihydrolipoamide succinyltransferase)